MSDPVFADVSVREVLRQRLNAIPGISMAPDVISRRPSVPLAVLQEPGVLAAFLPVFDDVVSALRTDSPKVFAPITDPPG
jgi:hypothetical protein